MADVSAPQTLRFTDQHGTEQFCDRQGDEAADAFLLFVAQRRADDNHVFTVEAPGEQYGLRFDLARGVIARYRHFFEQGEDTPSRTFEDYTLLEDEERSRALVRALVDDGFGGPYPLAAWMPGIPTVPDVPDDDPDAREVVLRSGSGASQILRFAHPNDTTYPMQAFLVRHAGHDVSIEWAEAGERLEVMGEASVLVRTAGLAGDGAATPTERREFLKVDQPRRVATAAHRFLEGGFAGLDGFGQWVADIAVLDLPPAQLGRHRASSFTTDAEILAEVGRLWADSGIVDPSDRFWVFFESRSRDEDEAERAELLALLDRLGIEPSDLPDGAPTGEVWVAREPRLDAEIDSWA